MNIELEGHRVRIHLEYGVRKKISLAMDASGFITVKAPNGTSEEVIESAVKKHSKQILQQLRAIEQSQDTTGIREYQEEGKFLHLGKYYALQELIETEGRTEDELKVSLKKFYFASCKKVIGERLKVYQQQLKAKAKSFEIVESRTKWGTCSSSKQLTFNYRLAMAPLAVIDYVVIHELCHLFHMNHDRSFWRLVGSIMPDYKEKEAYLARYGRAMEL
ncbi:M48 family metallopeptidase [Paenibacillus sp. N1-5-1-14]|uniref:M48 family metallopeptidase n=1 Tax=Paenibacillus radicibacter TaxID=2972488 RepID=UPI00215904F9|nr:SprT family zinc-dependent metalloprotease [Paenibacillus radicibacter]MCR8643177.1 M48 family metallopeptidase [Paenibacillus radicibacter]